MDSSIVDDGVLTTSYENRSEINDSIEDGVDENEEDDDEIEDGMGNYEDLDRD